MKLAILLSVIVGLIAVACVNDRSPEPATNTPSQTAPSPVSPPEEAVTTSGGGSCVESFSTPTLRARAFAFDGTVAEIGTEERLLYVDVVFDVHEWFQPDGPDQVSVLMFPPGATSSVGGPDYAVGTRMLVTGEPRWGGAPLDEPVAWTCGFTRPFDETDAAAWRDARS